MSKSVKKIALTGPESSGKTGLASLLAAALQAPVAPEFARCYLECLGRPYTRADLKTIGRGQKAWENWYLGRASEAGFLVLDTDWTVLHIWESYRFEGAGNPEPENLEHFEWKSGYGPVENADLYLLCAPDVPWQPDPLREHPEARAILFDLYFKLLQRAKARFVVLEGDLAARLQKSLAAIENLK